MNKFNTPGHPAAGSELQQVMERAAEAAKSFKKMPAAVRASFLDAIAGELERAGPELISLAHAETHLSEAQLLSERARTVGQLRQFGALVREGSWVDASIDTALPDRKPIPKNDLRSMLVPIGPVLVFGASNFPFAYSTAGGDTASALAAACPVIVKAHPAHAATSEYVGKLICRAAENTGMPEGVFQHVPDTGQKAAHALVLHPLVAAVGFTGSFQGGKAIFDLANRRSKPIPVFAEMGSVNPVCILPETLKSNAAEIAAMYVRAITNGMGQFCTKPGLQLVPDNEDLSVYVAALSSGILQVMPAYMLHPGIASSFAEKRNAAVLTDGVRVEATVANKDALEAIPTIASVSAELFLKNPALHEEVFGPYSLLIRCKDRADMLRVIQVLEGQLTATILGTEAELMNNTEIIESLTALAGRIIINGVPTGVEVCPSMVHGGPFPASTDSRFTAVGLPAIRRFLRPVCFQNFPQALLPEELKDENPRKIWRLVNNQLSCEDVMKGSSTVG